jgi:hypothetical protein
MDSVRRHCDANGNPNSVFTVSRGSESDSQFQAPPDQAFDLAVIEFKDDGWLADARQLGAALDCIGAPGATSSYGDDHFKAFRRILMTLAWREVVRNEPRRVVGGYLA